MVVALYLYYSVFEGLGCVLKKSLPPYLVRLCSVLQCICSFKNSLLLSKSQSKWLLAFLMTVSGSVQAGVSVFPQKIMLGEPVILVISGDNIEKDFERFDKDKIRQSFEIFDIDGDGDRLRLTLYPRRVGVLEFPAIRQGKIQFSGTEVVVEPNSDVSIEWYPPQSSSYPQRWQVWSAEVEVDDSAFEVSIDKHPHYNKQLRHQVSQQSVQTRQHLSGKTERLMVVFSADQAGEYFARSPMVRIKHSGQRPWLFFDETRSLNFKALPGYLPSYLPVGEVMLDQQPLDFWLATGRLYQWQLELQANNVMIENLPDVTAQLTVNSAIEWLTPEVTKSQDFRVEGISNQLLFDQPFRVNQLGLFRLPDLRVTYFDPQTGKLADSFLKGQWLFAVPIWLIWLLQLVKIAISVLVVILLMTIFYQLWAKLHLQHALNRAQSTQQVWQSIQHWSASQLVGFTANDSLGQWQSKMDQQFDMSLTTDQLVRVLNQYWFSEQSPEVNAVAQAWLSDLPNFQLSGLIQLAKRVAIFFKRND